MLWGLLGFLFSAALVCGKEEGARSMGESTVWAARRPRATPDPHLSLAPIALPQLRRATVYWKIFRFAHPGGQFSLAPRLL